MSNLDIALILAGRHWSILPCHHQDETYQDKSYPKKSPYLRDWPHRSTMDIYLIRAWWTRWPDALIGINCQASGIFALDIDFSEETNGYKTFAELAASYGANNQVVVGPCQTTPRGGLHMIWRMPAVPIGSNSGVLGPGLDLRGIGGYITTGPEYTSKPGHELISAQLTDAPPWLIEAIRKRNERPAPPPERRYTGDRITSGEYWLRKAINQSVKGRRNSTGFWLSIMLRDSGLTIDQAEVYLIRYADAMSDGDYSKSEALASLQSAYKRAPRDPAQGEERCNHDNQRLN